MRTSGIDDLVTTLVKQHGLELALDLARHQRRALIGIRCSIWSAAYHRLLDMRLCQLGH